jgi:hypothetical protein
MIYYLLICLFLLLLYILYKKNVYESFIIPNYNTTQPSGYSFNGSLNSKGTTLLNTATKSGINSTITCTFPTPIYVPAPTPSPNVITFCNVSSNISAYYPSSKTVTINIGTPTIPNILTLPSNTVNTCIWDIMYNNKGILNTYFNKMVLSGFVTTTPANIYNTFFTYTPNGTIFLSIQAFLPVVSSATPYIYYKTAIKGQANLGTWNRCVNGLYTVVVNPNNNIIGGIWSDGAHYYYPALVSSTNTFNPSQVLTTALGQGATKMLLGTVAKAPLAAVGKPDVNTFAILQQDFGGGNTVNTSSTVTSQKFIFSRFNYDTTWLTLPLPTTNIVTSWSLDSTAMSYASTQPQVSIFSILNYKKGVSSTIYYVDIASYIPVTNNVLGALNLTTLAQGWKQVILPVNPLTNTPRIFSEFSIGRNLKGFFIEEVTGSLYSCDNVGSTSPKWTRVIISGAPVLKKINYIVNDLDMILASDTSDNLYIDYNASNM